MRGLGDLIAHEVAARSQAAQSSKAGSDTYGRRITSRKAKIRPKSRIFDIQKQCIDRTGRLPYPTSTSKASTDTKRYIFTLTSLD